MKYLSEEQIQNIRENSTSLPIFFAEKGDTEKIIAGLSIVELGQPTIMGVPEYIELEKYNASGIITTARYQLVDSYKTHEKNLIDIGDPGDN